MELHKKYVCSACEDTTQTDPKGGVTDFRRLGGEKKEGNKREKSTSLSRGDVQKRASRSRLFQKKKRPEVRRKKKAGDLH